MDDSSGGWKRLRRVWCHRSKKEHLKENIQPHHKTGQEEWKRTEERLWDLIGKVVIRKSEGRWRRGKKHTFWFKEQVRRCSKWAASRERLPMERAQLARRMRRVTRSFLLPNVWTASSKFSSSSSTTRMSKSRFWTESGLWHKAPKTKWKNLSLCVLLS